MKTTVELPDTLFRKTKATAAERGVSLKLLLTEAVREHLQRDARDAARNHPGIARQAATHRCPVRPGGDARRRADFPHRRQSGDIVKVGEERETA